MSVRFDYTSPEGAAPEVKLTGRLIIANGLTPEEVQLHDGTRWATVPRQGNSALHSSFANLVDRKHSNWEVITVAWTGKISGVSSRDSAKSQRPALSRASTGMLPPTRPDPNAPAHRVTPEDQEEIENLLYHSKTYGKILPIWLGDRSGTIMVGDELDHWSMFSRTVLWTVMHYIPASAQDGATAHTLWNDYVRFNEAYAEKILSILQPGDVVWIHDTQLLLLAGLLRKAAPWAYVGLFLHTPFPSSELVKTLAPRQQLLEGMLGANLIGFHNVSYLEHFISTCARILGPKVKTTPTGLELAGAFCAVGVFPIGIDASKVEASAMAERVERKMALIRQLYAGKKIIVGRDRLDSVRGVFQKLNSFSKFLERFPEWRGKVVLIQVSSPAVVQSSDRTIERKVNALIEQINGRFGSLEFTPVAHYPQYLDPADYWALLRVAELALITSVRDGMNITSLEYTVAQKDGHGPVILSEFSGTADCLSTATKVNPFDFVGVANAIDECLRLSEEERKARHQVLYEWVTMNTVQAWNHRFLEELVKAVSGDGKAIGAPMVNPTVLKSAYDAVAGTKRLLMFDYDGTLTPIVDNPNDALPTDKVLRTIKKLASDPENEVWIISGRDDKFLQEHWGHIPELGLSAEHGCFIRHPNGTEWENLAQTTDMSWRQEATAIFEKYVNMLEGSTIEAKSVAITFHYRAASEAQQVIVVPRCQEEQDALAKLRNLEAMPGKKNIEVRPKFINKGEIAKKLLHEYQERNKGRAFVMCCGDDTTDEDMFVALAQSGLSKEECFTIHIGDWGKATAAHYCLRNPYDLIDLVGLAVGLQDISELDTVIRSRNRLPREH